ncbi:MAG: hypothetical protein WCA46_20640, partial [Actinocatenispora sp.]
MANKVLDEAWKWMWILLTGQEYPDGDADGWREFGQRWKDLGDTIQSGFEDMGPTVLDVGMGWGGDSGVAFQNRWGQFVSDEKAGPTAYIKAAYEQFNASQAGALELEFSQLMLDMIVAITIIEFLIGVALAEFGGEALSAEAVAVGRPLVSRILTRLAEKLGEGILKRAVEAAAKFAATFAGRMLGAAALGGFNMAAANLLAQGIQVADGTRPGIDWGQVGSSAAWGGLGGLAGGLAGAGLNRAIFGKAGARELGGLMGRLPKGLTEGLPGKITTGTAKLGIGGLTNIPTIAAMNPKQFWNDLKEHPFQTLANDFVGGVGLTVGHGALHGLKGQITGEGRAPAAVAAPEGVEAPRVEG